MMRKITVMQKRATMFSHIAQLVGAIPWLHRYASPEHLQKSMGQKFIISGAKYCKSSVGYFYFPVIQRFLYPQFCKTEMMEIVTYHEKIKLKGQIWIFCSHNFS